MPILVASLEAWPVGLGVGVLLGLGTTMLAHGRAPAARPAPRQPG